MLLVADPLRTVIPSDKTASINLKPLSLKISKNPSRFFENDKKKISAKILKNPETIAEDPER